ncbi:hypothetical protein C823_006853 [Eubacterium plexicaudatum ASF492]|nr:hypothetical protein C823_006853 [Eubacterium plexicaudatum ASF492]
MVVFSTDIQHIGINLSHKVQDVALKYRLPPKISTPRKERGAWRFNIAVSKSYPAARASPLLPPPLIGRGKKLQMSLTE